MTMRKHIGIAAILCSLVMAATCFADYDSSVIKEVQQALNDAGFNCGTADGIAGKATTSAILEYQKENGLAEDGVISDELLTSLGIGTSGDAGTAEEGAGQYDDILSQSLAGSASADAGTAEAELSIDDYFVPAKFVDAFNQYYLGHFGGQDEYILSLPDTAVSQFNLQYYSTYSSTILNRTSRGFSLEYDHRDTPSREVDENAVYSKAIFEFDLYDFNNQSAQVMTDLTNLGNILQNVLDEPGLQPWILSAWDKVFFALAKDEVPELEPFEGKNVNFEFHFDEKNREYMYFWMMPAE